MVIRACFYSRDGYSSFRAVIDYYTGKMTIEKRESTADARMRARGDVLLENRRHRLSHILSRLSTFRARALQPEENCIRFRRIVSKVERRR